MKRFFIFWGLILTVVLSSISVSADKNKVSSIRANRKFSNGYYVLIPQCAPTRALTIRNDSTAANASVVSAKYTGKASQIFYLNRRSDGTYTLKNKNSRLYLGIKGQSTKSGAVVRQRSFTGGNYQRWYIFKYHDYYMIQSTISRNLLAVRNSSSLNNAPVRIQSLHYGMKGEHWILRRFSGNSSAGSDREETIPHVYEYSSKTGMSAEDYKVLNNIIGAVETGGQVYGQRDYADYTPPYANTSNEHTCTLGWGAFYGEEAQYLVSQILKKDPTTFKKIDSKGLIQAALKKNWVSTRWKPNATEKNLLIKLITTKTGKAIQDAMVTSLMKQFVSSCNAEYTTNTWATMMYCQIRHLGGKSGADRIFQRCKAKKSYTLDTIMWALKKDQADTSSSYQVGDSIFWSRHKKCCEFIQKYA